ncbi:lipopolysaccharide kinase InaA family protein [Kitasatospora sp. MMS16-BH015]|uniref:protein kinase domain-containing protein n=1 Tax=Kitasatospora sp. MMS16-BH015 TaxID=2018025 RepID=UPI00131A525B|nr:lipopolysaccharide kinase InaA family protein [Kitasatospora sp. MMS16-BH015]
MGGFVTAARLRARGCSAVYRAHGPVALKLACLAAPAAELALLDHERAVLDQLRHSGLAPRPLGHDSCGAVRYLASEWRSGVPLAHWLHEHGPVARARTPETAELFAAVAGAVAEAFTRLHEHGIAHGDVSPTNILLTPDGEAALVDFENARPLAGPAGPARGGKVTRLYAPPELELLPVPGGFVSDGRPTAASDQYAVAAVLGQVLNGTVPGPRSTVDREALVTGWPARSWPGLAPVLGTALHADPRLRHPSMREFAAALEECLT